MTGVAALLRSERARDLGSYPFRLGPRDARWRSSPFAGLAVVNNLSGVGDALVTVALAGSVFVSVSLHAARGRTALGLLCTVAPFAIVGPLVGPVIDRVRGGRKFVVFLAAIGRMAACLMMAAWIHSLLLFPAAFLSLVCSKTHSVARASLVPVAVGRPEDLVRANSRLAVGGAIFTSLGAACGAGVYRLFGSRVLLDLDVLVFAALAGLSLYLLGRSGEPGGAAEPASGPAGVAGARPARGRLLAAVLPARRAAVPHDVTLGVVAMAGMRAAAGFLTALVVFAFRREGAPLIWYGLVAVGSVGGNFAGALAAPRLRDRVPERRLVGAAALVVGAAAIGVTQMGAMQRRPAALLLAFVVALGETIAKAAFDAVVQSDVADEDRSRLFARFESIFQLVWVAGALIPTLIATSLFAGFVFTAVVVLATSAVFVAGLARGGPGGGTGIGGGAGSGATGPARAGAPGGWGPPAAP